MPNKIMLQMKQNSNGCIKGIMNKKVLFLDGYDRTGYYNNERNKYGNVTATSIFLNKSILRKMLSRLVILLKLPGLSILFDDWKRDIDDYGLFIIPASIYSLEIAKYIRKRSNKRIIHWYWNPVSSEETRPDKISGYDCDLFSFDQNDCKKYGMNYVSTYYFSSIQFPENIINNDIYFIGADKGRVNKLLDLKKTFEDQGLKVKFHITKSSNSKKVKKYTLQPQILYAEVLEEIAKCRAILDIVQVGQAGMSQRPMEALFHNKKLITNDVNIDKYDFYNRNNIFILGKNDISGVREFINSPYVIVDKEIVEKYDFKNWLNQIQKQISI